MMEGMGLVMDVGYTVEERVLGMIVSYWMW